MYPSYTCVFSLFLLPSPSYHLSLSLLGSSPWICPSPWPILLGTYCMPGTMLKKQKMYKSQSPLSNVQSRHASKWSCLSISYTWHKSITIDSALGSRVTEGFKEVVTHDWAWRTIVKIQDGQGEEGHFKDKRVKMNDIPRVLHDIQNSIKWRGGLEAGREGWTGCREAKGTSLLPKVIFSVICPQPPREYPAYRRGKREDTGQQNGQRKPRCSSAH